MAPPRLLFWSGFGSSARLRLTVTRREPFTLEFPGMVRVSCHEGALWITGDPCGELILQPSQQATLRDHGRVVAQGLPSARVELRWSSARRDLDL